MDSHPTLPSSPASVHAHEARARTSSIAIRQRGDDDDDDDERHVQRGATELSPIDHSSTGTPRNESASRRRQSGSQDANSERAGNARTQQSSHWFESVRKWWVRHVSVSAPIEKRRDHLALERTFLGYVRTSVALSMTGVTVAQLFRLQHSINPDPDFGYYVVGVPIGVTFVCASIFVVLVGAFRFWRQQSAMFRGKCFAGGWEIVAIMGLSIILCVALFAVLLAADIRKTYG
ncbi:hypothetical protein NA57DRAFT_74870 [Rhizodiscina lignyota]|uniref:DUF202 domain-containing protein n=1 Tax=Rhizodiscina lignyota TaxID=1504668 RepID=A0A9P4MB47_9PEZI|nr:hypothetical protein NA57DRAFT_74870 [Rhizodiscina lignyota]